MFILSGDFNKGDNNEFNKSDIEDAWLHIGKPNNDQYKWLKKYYRTFNMKDTTQADAIKI